MFLLHQKGVRRNLESIALERARFDQLIIEEEIKILLQLRTLVNLILHEARTAGKLTVSKDSFKTVRNEPACL